MAKDLFAALKDRRSYYSISKDMPISDARLKEIVEASVLNVPSAFNSQSARAIVLTGSEHTSLWSIVRETLRKIVPPQNFAPTEQKLAGFDAGYGTILFFEDDAVVTALQKEYTLFKDNFPIWSMQSNGMLQFFIWMALEAEGLGCSLQHYNPLIDDEVKAKWNLPDSWKLVAQLPFGKPVGEPGGKEFLPVEDRVKFFS